ADTREAGVQLTAGVPYPVDIAGAGVPADVTAALLNLTVVEPATAGYVTAYPCGDAIPYVSNVNYVAGQVIANSATVKVGEQGQVCVVSSADTHLVVDLNGVFAEGASGALPVPTSPRRLLDTRE